MDYENYKSRLGQERGMERLCGVAHRIWSIWADAFGGAYQTGGRTRRLSLTDFESDVLHDKCGNERGAKGNDQQPLDL